MMTLFLAELIGTALLIVLGNGVVANVTLKRSKAQGAGWMVVATGWGLAVAMAVYTVGRISGAHINPAVTLGLAAIGSFPWSQVPLYLIAQFAGGILGATIVWLTFLPHWEVTPDPADKLGVFATAPAIRRFPSNLIAEIIGTAVLLFGILAIADNAQLLKQPGDLDLSVVFDGGFKPLLVGFLVWSIGLSLGGPTGYAINPARDLGPRIAHFILPIAGKGGSDWSYSWIPIVGPIIGGIGGALLYSWLAF
jgi:glycerol uptake facilitator protein